ncbi:serine/threonine-protein phosphatase 6 regulatory ankyrin repeat subunit A-like isoform X2 [Oncorhynchus nerka]|uniref:serine/threonine-protein phosphatase 6 regulatory ankyrin repeat subunit A-like isoform X2 n=1 Tax=Oncorhynchus nerka TaxID=8023 RepID=UPI0031B84247
MIASETPLDVLMETSGTDILNDSDVRAPISPLHLANPSDAVGAERTHRLCVLTAQQGSQRRSQRQVGQNSSTQRGADGSRGVKHSASFLVQEGKGRSHVHLVAASGHIGVLGWLLHTAQSVWTLPVITNNQGYTPLHWACYNASFGRARTKPSAQEP